MWASKNPVSLGILLLVVPFLLQLFGSTASGILVNLLQSL